MSSVKPDRSAQDAARTAALLEEHEQFCAEVADGLHTLAQPLTILRSAIAMLARANDDGIDGRRYVEMSMRQIERTCQLFSSVQELLSAKMVPADLEPINIGQLMTRIADDCSHSLHERDIKLAAIYPTSLGNILGDLQRTEKAISAMLETAISISSAGDVVKVDASPSDGFLEISIESTCRLDNTLKSFDRLNLSLARTYILSQQGQYQFTEEPFRISLALPALQPESEASETICYAACID